MGCYMCMGSGYVTWDRHLEGRCGQGPCPACNGTGGWDELPSPPRDEDRYFRRCEVCGREESARPDKNGKWVCGDCGEWQND